MNTPWETNREPCDGRGTAAEGLVAELQGLRPNTARGQRPVTWADRLPSQGLSDLPLNEGGDLEGPRSLSSDCQCLFSSSLVLATTRAQDGEAIGRFSQADVAALNGRFGHPHRHLVWKRNGQPSFTETH